MNVMTSRIGVNNPGHLAENFKKLAASRLLNSEHPFTSLIRRDDRQIGARVVGLEVVIGPNLLNIAGPKISTSAESPTFTGDDIGRRVIEGLPCRGYRGKSQHGGTVEYWVSEELLEVVLARSLLRGEENTLRLFNIHRIEPDSKMFTVPADYKTAAIEQPDV